MSDQAQQLPGNALNRATIAAMLASNFGRLPEVDQKLFTYGSLYPGGNAGLAGLISNSLFRRALNVTQAPFSSSLPMAVLPFISTVALYDVFVSQPLLYGDLNCPSCAVLRGALVGVVAGGLYPILLALPMNIGLASLYSTAPMPQEGNKFRYAVDLSKPILRKMRAVLLIQAFFTVYLSSRQFGIYTKLAQITFGQGEELTD